MSEALELKSRQQIEVTSDQTAIARNTVAKGLTDDEFAVYLYNCQRQGIHPLDGLLIPIVRNDSEAGGKKLTFVTTVDLLRSRAAETDAYAGSEDPVFEHDAEGKPISATVTVWKFVQGQKCGFTATARYAEYVPPDKQAFMWKSKPHVMLGKCAEGLAIRKAFPKELAGLYLAEELQKEPSPPRATKAQQKATGGVPGDVMCASCRAIGGHLPGCQFEKPKEEPVKTLIKMACLIVDVAKKESSKNKKPFVLLTVATPDDKQSSLFVWHQSMHAKLLDSKGANMSCDVSIGTTESKTFMQLEKIYDINGVPYVEAKPATEEMF